MSLSTRWAHAVFILILSAAEGWAIDRPVTISLEGGSRGARGAAERAARDLVKREEPPGPERIAVEVGRALVREGWGSGEVEAIVDSLGGDVESWRIRLHALKPARLAEWTWEGACDLDEPPAGVWTPERRAQELRGLVERAQGDGHPFASIQILEAVSSEEGMRVRARFREGPLLRLRSLVFEGRGATRESYLSRLTGLKPGEPVRPGRAELGRERIARSGLFSIVEGPWLRNPEEGLATLVYRMTPAAQNRADGAIGYDGLRKTLSGYVHMEIGNLFGTGRRFNGEWERLDRDRSRLALAYREPFVLGLPLAVEGALSQEIEDSTWTADEWRGVLEGDLGGFTARAGLAGRRIVDSRPPGVRTSGLHTILGAAYDGRSQMGTRGARHEIEVRRGELDRTPDMEQGEGTLVGILLRGEQNRPIGLIGHLRGEYALGWVEGPDSLPRPDALGLGGGASLRGYPEQALRVLRYALLRLEGGVRMLPEGNRVYAFVDGALYRDWPGEKRSRLASYGVGFRVRGAGGWVRLDYGIPTDSPPLSGRIHFRLETRF
ncbi:MAG: hypothetical protein FJY88_08905 [Candidatus Eisenbacteria bacterium]|nr:hypothetical protein [Candidatus Eisenbacteria bacterium]